MIPSSLDKFAVTINQLPTNPSDITTGFFDDAGSATTLRIHYFKCGKLIYGFWYEQLVNGQCGIIIGGQSALELTTSAARIALQLGFTVNTIYSNTNHSMYAFNSVVNWDGAKWAPTTNTTIYSISSILVN